MSKLFSTLIVLLLVAILAISIAILVVTISSKNQDENNNNNSGSETVIVQIDSGRIRGFKETTMFNKNPFYAFRGIPFAQPPINELRFKVIKKKTSTILLLISKFFLNFDSHHKK